MYTQSCFGGRLHIWYLPNTYQYFLAVWKINSWQLSTSHEPIIMVGFVSYLSFLTQLNMNALAISHFDVDQCTYKPYHLKYSTGQIDQLIYKNWMKVYWKGLFVKLIQSNHLEFKISILLFTDAPCKFLFSGLLDALKEEGFTVMPTEHFWLLLVICSLIPIAILTTVYWVLKGNA